MPRPRSGSSRTRRKAGTRLWRPRPARVNASATPSRLASTGCQKRETSPSSGGGGGTSRETKTSVRPAVAGGPTGSALRRRCRCWPHFGRWLVWSKDENIDCPERGAPGFGAPTAAGPRRRVSPRRTNEQGRESASAFLGGGHSGHWADPRRRGDVHELCPATLGGSCTNRSRNSKNRTNYPRSAIAQNGSGVRTPSSGSPALVERRRSIKAGRPSRDIRLLRWLEAGVRVARPRRGRRLECL